jgi:hypothetical protein
MYRDGGRSKNDLLVAQPIHASQEKQLLGFGPRSVRRVLTEDDKYDVATTLA